MNRAPDWPAGWAPRSFSSNQNAVLRVITCNFECSAELKTKLRATLRFTASFSESQTCAEPRFYSSAEYSKVRVITRSTAFWLDEKLCRAQPAGQSGARFIDMDGAWYLSFVGQPADKNLSLIHTMRRLSYDRSHYPTNVGSANDD